MNGSYLEGYKDALNTVKKELDRTIKANQVGKLEDRLNRMLSDVTSSIYIMQLQYSMLEEDYINGISAEVFDCSECEFIEFSIDELLKMNEKSSKEEF